MREFPQVVANVVFIVTLLKLVIRYKRSGRIQLTCIAPTLDQPDLEGEGDNDRLAFIVTFYLYVRILDFLDTVLFILMKKMTHVSFLHVYHHFIVVVTGGLEIS